MYIRTIYTQSWVLIQTQIESRNGLLLKYKFIHLQRAEIFFLDGKIFKCKAQV